MSRAREQFRNVLTRPICTLAANIFDPLSARIAHMLGYEVCVLSGSAGKAANLAVPDLVLSNMSDVVDHCRRIIRLKHVKDGGSLEALQDRQASPALLRAVNRTDEFIQQQQTYFP